MAPENRHLIPDRELTQTATRFNYLGADCVHLQLTLIEIKIPLKD